MEQMLIGSYLRQQRENNGWTQEYLCAGICNSTTLSRIENDERTPSRAVVNALLERLGLPAGTFFSLLSKNDIRIDKLEKSILNDRVLFRRASESKRGPIYRRILKNLKELEHLAGEDTHFVRQLTLSIKASIGKPDGPYSPEERLAMLMEAIRLTVPYFDVKKISDFRYTVKEVMIVNQIARTYAQLGKRNMSIRISRQLLRYIEKNNRELDCYSSQFCLVAHNCAIDLTLTNRYNEAIALAEKGLDICKKWGNYEFLAGFLAIMAECYFFVGNREKSSDLYHQAYILYKVLGDESNQTIMKREMKDHLGEEPPYSTM